MTLMLATFALAVLAAAPATDTTFAVRPAGRLELNNFSGSITVKTWARNEVRVAAEHTSRVEIAIENSGPLTRIKAVHRRGHPSEVDYELTVPAGLGLDLSGVMTDIEVEGVSGEVNTQSVQGEIVVTGGRNVKAGSVDGDIRIRRASGKIECTAVNGDVRVADSRGSVLATTVNGQVRLEAIDSDDVQATTVNGEIDYGGPIKDRGTYRFESHAGSVRVAVPERTNATVSVATFSGDFSSSFPVQLTETRRGGRLHFVLGTGSARLELESFAGEIQLHRPGEPAGRGRETGDRRERSK